MPDVWLCAAFDVLLWWDEPSHEVGKPVERRLSLDVDAYFFREGRLALTLRHQLAPHT